METRYKTHVVRFQIVNFYLLIIIKYYILAILLIIQQFILYFIAVCWSITQRMALSRKEVDEIKPWLKDTVKKRLGYSEKSVVNAAIQCLQNNLDKDSACKELTSLLDDLAPRFVDDLFSKLDRIRRPKSSNRSSSNKKRTLEDVFGDSRDDEDTRNESETLKKRKKTRSSDFPC